MTIGPVFRAELLTTARRRRYYVIRALYGLALLTVISRQFRAWNEMHPDGAAEVGQLTRFTTATFDTFAWTQGIVVFALTPALVAGVIAEEKQRKTLHYLLASELSGAEIVLSKLAARLLHILILLALGIPIFSLLSIYGGVDPEYVGLLYLLTLALIGFEAGLSILMSVIARRPRGAVGMVYLILLGWIFVPMMLEPTLRHIAWPFWFAWLTPLLEVLLWTNPLVIWRELHVYQDMTMGGSPLWISTNPWFVTAARSARVQLITASGILALLGLVASGLAVLLLRPMFRAHEGSRQPRSKPRFVKADSRLARPVRFRPARDRSGCGDSPMLWKERIGWRTRGPLQLLIQFGWLAFAVLIGCVIFDMTRTAVAQMLSGGIWGSGGETARREFHGAIRFFTAMIFPIWALGVAGGAAGGITGEREQDTWLTLTSTTLTGREILTAKVFGAIWGMRWPALGLLAFWVAGVLTLSLHPLSLPAAILVLASAGWFASSVGTYASLRASNSLRATTVTFAILLAFSFLLPRLMEYATGSQSPVLVLFLSAPTMLDTALFDPGNLAGWTPGRPPVEAHRSWPASTTVPILALSILAHAVPAWLLTRAAIAGFDRIVDRPRRPETRIAPRPASATA